VKWQQCFDGDTQGCQRLSRQHNFVEYRCRVGCRDVPVPHTTERDDFDGWKHRTQRACALHGLTSSIQIEEHHVRLVSRNQRLCFAPAVSMPGEPQPSVEGDEGL